MFHLRMVVQLLFMLNSSLIQYNFAPIFLTIRKQVLWNIQLCSNIQQYVALICNQKKKSPGCNYKSHAVLCLANRIFKLEKQNHSSSYGNILDSLWHKLSNYILCFRIYNSEKSFSFLVLFIFQLSRWAAKTVANAVLEGI